MSKKTNTGPSLIERLQTNSTLEYADILADSEIYNVKDEVATPILALNIAYSGRVDGGITPGTHLWCGPSKHFKSMYCLISAASYLKKYPEAVVLFYDNEFGSPKAYFESVGINPNRVLHCPFFTLEDLRHDIVNQLNGIKRGDKVIIVIDSLGMAASAKEVHDAEDGKEKADMTRAKVNKSLFRIILPHLRVKDIPLLAVQHVYDTMEMYAKKIVSGGTGQYLAAENIYIIGRQQDKEGKEVVGYDFIINIEKSRYVREKSKIPINVSATAGLSKWTGLFDMALELGIIEKVTAQSYRLAGHEEDDLYGKMKRDDIEYNSAFWKTVFAETNFAELLKDRFAVSHGELISEDE